MWKKEKNEKEERKCRQIGNCFVGVSAETSKLACIFLCWMKKKS